MRRFKKGLPAELTDRVIDHLHSDKLALATCSLVCKTWLPASRYHFFQTTIRLTNRNIHSLVDLLNSPASTFFDHKLNVKIVPTPLSVGYQGVNYIFDTISHHLFRLKIESLSLSCMKWDISGETLGEIFEYFATIPALTLQDVMFSTPNQFIAFLKSFLSLESLSLRNATFGIHHSAHTTPFTLSPLLRAVDVAIDHWKWDPSTMPWFLSTVQFPPLEYLGIFYIENASMHAVQAVLQSLGPSLHDLHLRFVGPGLLDLTHNVNLRHLRVEGLGGKTLLNNLSRIASFDLETIYFEVINDGAVVKWDQLAQVLTQDRFVKLQKVHFDVICPVCSANPYDCPGPGWVDHIRQQMSILGDVLDVSVFHFE